LIELRVEKNLSGLKELNPELKKGIIRGVNVESKNLLNYINTRHLRGGTSGDRLASPSGRLRGSGKPMIAKQVGNEIQGGVQYGGVSKGAPVLYAPIHIGRRGQETTIKAKSGGALSIPILYGRTPAGKESAKAKKLKDSRKLSFIARAGESPLLVLTGKGKFQPMYVLKKSVKIKTRVHPEEILKLKQEQIVQTVAKEVRRAIESAKARGLQ